MQTLLLMRHAKAVADDPGGDHSRALSPRGHDDARAAGTAMSRWGRPDLALVSDARRTRETLVGVALGLGHDLPHRFEPKLYAASPDAILAVVAEAPAAAEKLLVIGHNPGIGDLARSLARSGTRAEREDLANRFATSTFAVLRFEGDGWRDLGRGARLEALVTRG